MASLAQQWAFVNGDEMQSVVTVMIPTFNRPDWLEESLASVWAQQDDVDVQLILMDNGSTDGSTPEICRKWAERFDRCVLLSQESNSFANIGLMYPHIRGDYVCCFTDDDRMLPGNLRTKVQALDDHPFAAICFSPGWVIDPLGRREGACKGRWMPPHTLGSLLVTPRFLMPSTILKREFFIDPPVGWLKVGGEWGVYLEALSSSPGRVVQVPEPLVELRVHPASDTETRGFRDAGFVQMHLDMWNHWILQRGYRPTECEWREMLAVLNGLLCECYGQTERSREILQSMVNLKKSLCSEEPERCDTVRTPPEIESGT